MISSSPGLNFNLLFLFMILYFHQHGMLMWWYDTVPVVCISFKILYYVVATPMALYIKPKVSLFINFFSQ